MQFLGLQITFGLQGQISPLNRHHTQASSLPTRTYWLRLTAIWLTFIGCLVRPFFLFIGWINTGGDDDSGGQVGWAIALGVGSVIAGIGETWNNIRLLRRPQAPNAVGWREHFGKYIVSVLSLLLHVIAAAVGTIFVSKDGLPWIWTTFCISVGLFCFELWLFYLHASLDRDHYKPVLRQPEYWMLTEQASWIGPLFVAYEAQISTPARPVNKQAKSEHSVMFASE